jgi:predicted DNA-binding protein (MmcQ/YjbR family)
VTPDELRAYALAKPGAWPDSPWEGDHVAKVGGKIFAFLGEETLGVKCAASREEADAWLDRFPDAVTVMAYIGRHGWNTLSTDGGIPDDELLEAVDRSYSLVVTKLPKASRPAGWDA